MLDVRRLNQAQRNGRACAYCRVTFGAMRPIDVHEGTVGLLFLFAHDRCAERAHAAASGSAGTAATSIAPGRFGR
jgi:hypothetical protein